MRELVGSKNTIGQMASVLKKLQKTTFTFYLLHQQPRKDSVKRFNILAAGLLTDILLLSRNSNNG